MTPRATAHRETLIIRIARTAGCCAIVPCLITLGACSSTSGGSGVVDQTLQTVGLQKFQPPTPSLAEAADAIPRNLPATARKVTLRLHAGDVLNTDANGRSLSVVARVYKLRDRAAFETAPYADFEELKSSKAQGFAADIVAVKEVVLTPGKQYDVVETVGADAPYFAVVALFRAPAPQRWRFVFDSRSASVSGVTLGVHACALSVSAGEALGAAPELLRVAGVNCPST